MNAPALRCSKCKAPMTPAPGSLGPTCDTIIAGRYCGGLPERYTPGEAMPRTAHDLLPGDTAGAYQPKTGERCSCKRGVQRDNCAACEGTGWRIDFAAIRARKVAP